MPGGGCGQRLEEALGFDIVKGYVNYGVYKAPSFANQVRAFAYLQDLCRTLDLNLYSCNFSEARSWQDCCGVGKYPGFKPNQWAYYVNGHRITDHTSFVEYIKGQDCPWHDEFEQEWNNGKLAKSISELIFNKEDKTYTRCKIMCGGTSKPVKEELTTGGSSGDAFEVPQSIGTLGRDMELKKKLGGWATGGNGPVMPT
jgi:hypothetical protein